MRLISVCSMMILSTATLAHADQVVLEPAKDNTLYEDSAGSLSNGAGTGLFAGRTFSGSDELRRGLLQFDLASSIPAGSVITSVRLTMQCTRSISPDVPVSLHRALADWGEGASDAPGQEGGGTGAMTGDATWLHTFFPSTFWANAGGDFNAAASATTDVGFVGSYTWDSTDALRDDAQSMLDNPAGNFGWVMIGQEAIQGTAKRFGTRESDSQTDRPMLTVDFCPPTSPAGWLNYGSGWPGTGGVIPALTAGNDPKICDTVTINIGNSSGAFTNVFLVLGFSSASIPTGLGGTLLVSPFSILGFPLPGGGLSLPGDLPCDVSFCGLSLFLQTVQADAGASAGFSFSQGLELQLGS